eukprot:5554924-Amphidinium_carterae.1
MNIHASVCAVRADIDSDTRGFPNANNTAPSRSVLFSIVSLTSLLPPKRRKFGFCRHKTGKFKDNDHSSRCATTLG